MHRFFADERGLVDGLAWLDAQDARHALRVLRLGEGDKVELVTDGARYRASIVHAAEDGVTLQVEAPLPSTEAATRLTLYQGLPKAEKMEWIVQKSTELGAQAVVPVAMRRCVTRLDARDGARKAERWQKIAREAVKQCGRVCAPQVQSPQPLRALHDALRAHDLLLVPWEDARDGSIAQALAPFAGQASLDVGVLIGPEGGIDPEEAQWLADEAGARLVTLGARILRTETAAMAAQVMVMTLRGEMG